MQEARLWLHSNFNWDTLSTAGTGLAVLPVHSERTSRLSNHPTAMIWKFCTASARELWAGVISCSGLQSPTQRCFCYSIVQWFMMSELCLYISDTWPLDQILSPLLIVAPSDSAKNGGSGSLRFVPGSTLLQGTRVFPRLRCLIIIESFSNYLEEGARVKAGRMDAKWPPVERHSIMEQCLDVCVHQLSRRAGLS